VKEMLASAMKPVTKDTQLDVSRVQEVQAIFDKDYRPEEVLWAVLEDNNYKQAIELLKTISSRRPSPERKFDQFTATIETTACRTSLLRFFGDVESKRLLFLGDDDFTSVAVASLGSARSVTVVDIDDRILDEIEAVSSNHHLGIKIMNYDARKKFPTDLRGKFDVIFTDPPYTTEGIELFTSRAIESLDKANKAARIYVCYGNSDRAKERFLPIYEVFANSGLMTRWVFDKFNRYQGAESIGSASSLFVTEATPKTKLIIKGDYEKPIYTNN